MSTELVERAKAGDPDAFAQIYREHRNHIYLMICKRVGRDQHLAEDLTQDVFTRALRSIHTWHDQGKDIGGWLAVIAFNLIRDHQRRALRQPAERLPEFDDYVAAIADTSPEADVEAVAVALADGIDLRKVVRDLLRPLRPAHRQALTLRYLKGLSFPEISRRTGIPANTVKSRVGAARTLLRGGR